MNEKNWIKNLWEWADVNNISNESIPRDQEKLLNLTELNLEDKNISEIPECIGNLKKLFILNLSKNNLKTVPDEIGNLNNLIELDISENNLKIIPNQLTNLFNLQKLYLFNNNIVRLPENIGNLQNLKTLSLSYNNLANLPILITNILSLKELYLANNKSLILEAPYTKYINYLASNKTHIELDYDVFNKEIISKDRVKANFMSNRFAGLLVDINNIDGIEIYDTRLYLKTKYSQKILIYEYNKTLEAKEYKMTFQGILNHDLCKVVLIDDKYGLRGYPINSGEYKELQYGFNYENDEIPF